MKPSYLLGLLLASTAPAGAAPVDEKAAISVPVASAPRITPAGDRALFTVSVPDWGANRFDEEIWTARPGTRAAPFSHNDAGSSWGAAWSPDGRSIAFLADSDTGPQVFISPADQYVPRRVTNFPTGAAAFEWSPDGRSIAVVSYDLPAPAEAEQRQLYGDFRVLRSEKPRASLYLVDLAKTDGAPRRLTGDGATRDISLVTFSEHGLRNNFTFSPDGGRIVFSFAPSLNILDAIQADIGVLELGTGNFRRLTSTPEEWDELPTFSPDGASVIFSSLPSHDFLSDNKLLIVPASGGPSRQLQARRSSGAPLGQSILVGWHKQGIYTLVPERAGQTLYLIGAKDGRAVPTGPAPTWLSDVSISPSGKILGLGADRGEIPDLWWQGRGKGGLDTAATLATWPAHETRIVQWTSPDGVAVEGILHVPAGLTKPAPLVVVLHGGPRDAARFTRTHEEFFPVEHWLAEGVAVFYPNYRGSIGYGAAFRRLTLTNSGNAEAIDINSGVDALIARGIAEPQRLAVVGHSWGGYLSAFLATSSPRFRAAIVASGITDNTVNYVLSNAGVSDLGYLQSSPWKNPARWSDTAAIGHIGTARTPTLILHGADDPVVPVANAQILDRALADTGVPVRTVLYGSTGHSDFRPKERLAAARESAAWLDRYLLGRPKELPWK